MKKFKFLAGLMAVVMAVTAFVVPAAAETIDKTARSQLKVGMEYSLRVAPLVFGDDFIDIPVDGKLTVNFQTFSKRFAIALYDADGVYITPLDVKTKMGEYHNAQNWWFTDVDNSFSKGVAVVIDWVAASEKAVGTLTYNVSKGRYYVRGARGDSGTSEYKLGFLLKNVDGKDVDEFGKVIGAEPAPAPEAKSMYTPSLSIVLAKDAKVQLGTILMPIAKATEKATWSSNGSKIATVDAKGTVTAKGKGTATISAKVGKDTLKIAVTVK